MLIYILHLEMLAVDYQHNTLPQFEPISPEIVRIATVPKEKEELYIPAPFDSSEIDRTNVWRTWTYLTQREMSKFAVRNYEQNDTLVTQTRGEWTIFNRDGSPYIFEFVRIMGETAVTFAMPTFLYADFVKTFPQYKMIVASNIQHSLDEDLTEQEFDDESEFLATVNQKTWTPAQWGADLPMKYWNAEEEIHWADNVSFLAQSDNIKHIHGNVYDVTFIHTYGTGGPNNNNAKVQVTTRVDKKTGKIYRVNYKDDNEDFEGDLDNNNNLKVASDKKSPDDYVYGYKVAKTLSGKPCIVKLMLPKTSRIACRADDWKMRVNEAWVTGIWEIEYDRATHSVKYGESVARARSFYYKERVCPDSSREPEFFYVVNELCKSNGFNGDLDAVCVPGIHFYFSQTILMNRAAAEFYDWGNGTPTITNSELVINTGFTTRAQKMGLVY